MSQLKNISGDKLAYLASTLAVAISKEFDFVDLSILGGFFNSVGDIIDTIAAQQKAYYTSLNGSGLK